MGKLKSLWGYIVAGLVAVVGILLYVLNLKQKKNNSLRAQIELADTKEDVARLDGEIKQLEKSKKKNSNEIMKLEILKSALRERKEALAKEEGARTTDEIENYWKDN